MPGLLQGKFAFVLHDSQASRLIAVRDVLGAQPLYQSWSSLRFQFTFFASQTKMLPKFCDDIISVPAGLVYSSTGTPYTRFHVPKPVADASLRPCLEASVQRGMESHCSAVLLSEDIGSIMVAWLAGRKYRNARVEDLESCRNGPSVTTDNPGKLLSLSIESSKSGSGGKLQRIAEILDTELCCISFSREEVLLTLPVVIYYLESFDVRTIRASIPLFILISKAKKLGIDRLLIGDGLTMALDNAEPHSFTQWVENLRESHLLDTTRRVHAADASSSVHAPFLSSEVSNIRTSNFL